MEVEMTTTQRLGNHSGTRFASVTPNDGADLTFHTRMVILGTDGDLAFTTVDGDDGIQTGLKGGIPYPMALRRIKVTGTTATGIGAWG
jgi:hypothetical protein